MAYLSLLYLGGGAAFFVLTAAFVAFCDRLQRSGS